MAQVDLFIRQHRELAALVQRLRAALKAPERRADAMRTELSRFVGTLSVHLSMEDQHLYPTLRKDPRTDVSTLASRFGQEMLPLAADVKAHSAHWRARAIREDWAGFVRSTSALLDRLEQRMQREESELYPLLT